MPESKMRIDAHRRLAESASREELDKLRDAWRDRFGPLPKAVENALLCAAIKLEATRRRIPMVEVRGEKLMLTRGGRFPRLTAPDPDSRLREVLDCLEKMPCR
jgi:transcription-repair coupling factor (superfamily II helicase)